jgi:hypothetical protein
VQVASGSRVSNSLIAALEVLKQGDMAAVEAAVATLAWQQLAALDSSLLADLALLVADGHAAGDGEAVQLYGKLLRHYAQVRTADRLHLLCGMVYCVHLVCVCFATKRCHHRAVFGILL